MNNSTSQEDCKMSLENEESGCFLRSLHWLTLKLKLLEKGATPPKWKEILLIFACLFSSSCSLTFLFPFLPEMILHFGYSEYDKATYGGMVASALFAGRIFGSMFWGWLADRKGRKKVILLCLILTGISAGLFGFSINITMAVILRFVCGLVNGVVGTSKAALYDLSDNSNQALGMTMLSLAWGSGMVMGPLLGGILATPCTKWPDFCGEDSLLGKFPFLLPSLFPFVASILVFVLTLTQLEETFVSSSEEKYESEIDLQVDEKPDKEGLDQNKLLLLKTPQHSHLFVHRGFSQNDDCEIHHHPVNGLLSRSVVSLCPEAEMSISLGREALYRQESKDQHGKLTVEMTTSVPHLPFDDNLVKNTHSVFSKSTSHIQTDPVISQDNSCIQSIKIELPNGSFKSFNGGTGPIYRLNGSKNKYLDGNVTSQPEAVLSVEDETKQYDQPLFLQMDEVEEDDSICVCCDNCFKLCCTNSSLHQLLRLTDIWTSIMLYTVLSFVTIGVDDIFPMFAATRPDYGGLGFSTNEIGMALGFATLPLLFLQVKLYPFFVSKLSIRKTFMVMTFICMVTCQSIPMLRTLINSPTFLWVALILQQVPFKIANNCCFASTSLLINNSAPPGLAGQANGLSMTTNAIGRTIAPLVAGLLFSWSVSHGQFIGAPFDIGFPFFILGSIFGISLIQCLFINPRLDKQKK